MDLFLLMGLLATLAAIVYVNRRQRRLDELDREEERTSSLPDDHRERGTAWEDSLSEYERDEDDGEDDGRG